MPRIPNTRRVTLPVDALERAGLQPGDEVLIEPDGPDRIVVRRNPPEPAGAFGVFDGLYEPDHLERLRSGERA